MGLVQQIDRGNGQQGAAMPDSERILHLILIKPTHYDDNGYPIQWLRSAIPSNTLACLNGLAEDCRKRNVLGDDVGIDITTYDETNRRVYPDRIIRTLRRQGGRSLIALVGVQSNQFPRALDLSRRFREAGLQVAIGGFHVSGCISMLKEMPDDMKEAQRLGITLYAGEAEEQRLDAVLKDAYAGTLKPLYNLMADLPDMSNQPMPILPAQHVRRTAGTLTSVDLGRGCPYQCSFCTIINVQGRKSRFRSADDLEAVIRENVAQKHQPLLHHRRQLRAQPQLGGVLRPPDHAARGAGLRHQVHDPGGHAVPPDPELHREGRSAPAWPRVFIGLENINPDSLLGAKKKQNRITDYRAMLQAWKKQGCITYAGYILGFPNDRKETIKRDIEIIKRELPVDILEFFILTPAAGLGGPQGPARQGHLDGPRHEQVRPQPSGRAPSHDVGRRVGGRLLVGVGVVLLARAHGNDHAALGGLRNERGQGHVHDAVVLLLDPLRPRASPRERLLPPQIPPRPAPDHAARERAGVLSALCLGDGAQPLLDGLLDPQDGPRAPAHQSATPTASSTPTLSLSGQEEGEFDALSLFTETRGGQGAVAKKRQEAAARAAVRAAVVPASPQVRANVQALPRTGSAG